MAHRPNDGSTTANGAASAAFAAVAGDRRESGKRGDAAAVALA